MDGQQDYERWIQAEAEGRADEADAVFAAVFRAAAGPGAPSSRFTAQTMAAVALAAERDTRRARIIRRVGMPSAAALALALGYASSGLVMSAFSAILVGALDLFIGSIVYVATTLRSGSDVWTVAGNLGKTAAALLTNPAVTTTILALQGMAVAALFALQRLLRSERDWQSWRS